MKSFNIHRLIVITTALFFFSGYAQEQQYAELVLINGKVWLGGDTPAFAEAIAIKGEWIVQTGTNDDIKKRVGKGTKVIDLKKIGRASCRERV